MLEAVFIFAKRKQFCKKRNEEIVRQFNGYNYLKLAKKHNITERSVRDIINATLGSHKYVTKNRMSMFDTS